jgi:hypothetical protein
VTLHLLETMRADLEDLSPRSGRRVAPPDKWPAGPLGLDELRVESASLLAWTGGLVLAMLTQLAAAPLRQHTEKGGRRATTLLA